jgi:hypothetical protein
MSLSPTSKSIHGTLSKPSSKTFPSQQLTHPSNSLLAAANTLHLPLSTVVTVFQRYKVYQECWQYMFSVLKWRVLD